MPARPYPPTTARPAPYPPTTAQPAPTTAQPPSDHGRRRWVVPVLAAAVVVAVAATVLITSIARDRQTASPTSEAGQTDSQPTTTEPYPTSDTTTPEPSPEPTEAGTPDTAAVAAFVRDHFANLPHDAETARENWAPENRPSEWEDDQFWDAYEAVTVAGDPEVSANGATFTVHVPLDLTPEDDDEPVTEDYRVIVVARDDRLLVVDLAPA